MFYILLIHLFVLILQGTTYWDAAVECETKNYTGIDNDVTEAINCYLLAIKIYVNHQRYSMCS